MASATSNKARVSYVATNNSNKLRINGQWGNTSYSTRYITTFSSDIRLKENIHDCNINALEFVGNIKVRSFDWKKDEGGQHQRIGFIADELEKLDKKLVYGGGYDKNGNMDVKCIDNFYLMGFIVKAIQELRKENIELKNVIKRGIRL